MPQLPEPSSASWCSSPSHSSPPVQEQPTGLKSPLPNDVAPHRTVDRVSKDNQQASSPIFKEAPASPAVQDGVREVERATARLGAQAG